MQKQAITSQHLAMAQKIIAFVQEQGWDVDGIEVYRYDDNAHAMIGDVPGEDWKGKELKWGLRLSVAPRDDAEVVKKLNSQTVI